MKEPLGCFCKKKHLMHTYYSLLAEIQEWQVGAAWMLKYWWSFNAASSSEAQQTDATHSSDQSSDK